MKPSSLRASFPANRVPDRASHHTQVVPSVQSDPPSSIPPLRYHVTAHSIARHKRGSLVDRGANGGILGNDAIVLYRYPHRTVDVTGIDNHEMGGLVMVDAYAKTISQHGDLIVILQQYAYHGLNRTIHSSAQIEANKNIVDDRSMKVGGKQCIRTNDGYIIPLDIINGLPYMPMCTATKEEFDSLPHTVLTSPEESIVQHVDNILSTQDDWYNFIIDLDSGLIDTPFDAVGNYRKREPTTATTIVPPPTDPYQTLEVAATALRALNDRFVFSTDVVTDPSDSSREILPPVDRKLRNPNYEQFRPYFLHAPIEKIRKTFENTTQFAANVVSGRNIIQSLRSPYPAYNVYRRNEPVATDTIFAEVPAHGSGGQTMAQIFVGRKSLVIDIFGMASSKEFVNTLEDVIRKRGAMDKLISDSAQVEISNRVKDILRALIIDAWQSEPHYQHQNFAENRWKHLQRNLNWVMNWRNVPAKFWLLCLIWVADVMNHTSEKSLGWKPPLQVLTGQTIDISILLCFMFWDIVYVTRYPDHNYSGEVGSEKSTEIRGRFVGFSWECGHALTFKILTDDTDKIIHRSRVRLAKDNENNLKLDAEASTLPERVFIRSKHDSNQDDVQLPTIDVSNNPFSVEDSISTEEGEQADPEIPTDPSPMDDPPLQARPTIDSLSDDDEDVAPHLRSEFDKDEATKFIIQNLKTLNPVETKKLSPEEMINRSFLMPASNDGTRLRATIRERVQEYKDGLELQPDRVRFKCLVNNDYEEIVAYNDIIDYIEADTTEEGVWKFRQILEHKKMKSSDPDYKGSSYNLLVEWEGGECTWEPLTALIKDDPVTVALYGKKHDLIGKPGWNSKHLKHIAKTQKKLIRLANQAKLHSFRTKPVYMYGYQIPRNHEQAMELDRQNGNTFWRDAEVWELNAIDEYDAFINKGRDYRPGPEYKKIRVHFVYACKHDGRHRARLVAGGHLTDTPIDSVYSSVVSLRGIRMLCFIGELNGLKVWATDIGSAYLESYTKEKIYIVGGPEFGDREGCVLIISRALYGLKSSGLRWQERLADVLRDMGFFPSKAERDIWMKDMGDHYEYIGTYVDDLCILSRNPELICKTLMEKHKFKLKESGEISFHLGCDFFRDDDGDLCYAPRKYIEKLLDNYKRLFGTQPKAATSPLIKNDHPELDDSELLDLEHIKIYQSLIGGLQWVIQIGRFDVSTAVMTLSRFRAAPRQGHMDRVKRIHGYMSKMRHAVIRIRTEEPDYSDLPDKQYDWSYSVYKGAKEEMPKDLPPPRGKPIVTTTFVDANLYHDMVSGRSVTGILHFFNKTPIDWYSKLQSTVETATFGSEFIAARTATEQVIDLRMTLRYLGIEVKGPSYMFGDNENVVNTSSMPHGKLHKRHNALSYHRVREAIAAGIIKFNHVRGNTNPADILSKHWDMPSVWLQLQPILFSKGLSGPRGIEPEEKKDGDVPDPTLTLPIAPPDPHRGE